MLFLSYIVSAHVYYEQSSLYISAVQSILYMSLKGSKKGLPDQILSGDEIGGNASVT